jgi:hypothetical protein
MLMLNIYVCVGEQLRDSPLGAAEHRFHVDVIYRTVDSMVRELLERIDGLREVANMFGFLAPSRFQVMSDTDLKEQAWILIKRFPRFLSATLPEELLQFKGVFFSSPEPCITRGALGLLEFLAKEQLCDIFPATEVSCMVFINLKCANFNLSSHNRFYYAFSFLCQLG